MFDKKMWKISAVYVLLQIVIWAKSLAFFQWHGFGRVAGFNRFAFSPEAIFFDFVFHEAMHVAIGVLALVFGARLRRLEWAKLALAVAVAVAVHNLAYWFTASHQSLSFSVIDFVSDFAILLAFVVAGYVVRRHWQGPGKGIFRVLD